MEAPMKGWKTILTGLGIAIAVPGLTYLSGVDWTQYVAPNVALAISGGLMIALRVVTSSPVFKK
jgi:hypothetical protein